MARHAHVFDELIVVVSGRLHLSLDHEKLVAEPGDLLIYPAGLAHAERSDSRDPLVTIFLAFTSPWTSRLPIQLKDRDAKVSHLAGWLLEDRSAVTAADLRIRTLMFRTLMAELRRLAEVTEVDDRMALAVREHIHAHLKAKLTIDQLARVAGLSRFHFGRKFRALTGRSPMEDVLHLRLARARDLLLTTRLPLKAIAETVGFADEYHLSHRFREHHHCSPGVFRERKRQYITVAGTWTNGGTTDRGQTENAAKRPAARR